MNIIEDYAGVEGEVMMMLADAKDRLEAVAFVNGTGTKQPIGIVTALSAGSQVVAAAGEALAVADVYKVKNALTARYRSQGVFVASPDTIDALRQLGDSDHEFLVDLGAAAPTQLIGYRLAEDESMADASDIDATATATHDVLLFGDFRNYLIVDRIGMAVEFVPHLFNTSNNLPDGRRGWFAHWRVGADSINDAGFTLLRVTTAA